MSSSNDCSPSEGESASPAFMWHDESPTFPIPKTQFHMTYDSQMIVDQSYLPSSPDPKMLTNQGVLHCQEISKPISAVCMDCWRAKVKCDRQSPCSKFRCPLSYLSLVNRLTFARSNAHTSIQLRKGIEIVIHRPAMSPPAFCCSHCDLALPSVYSLDLFRAVRTTVILVPFRM